MSAESRSIPVEALLEHHAFVRALARRLLADEHAAEDVAQDTWAATIATPPSAIASVKGWLARATRNRAINARREHARRSRREASVARDELVEPTDVAERVELESRVVRAVLALREPYKSVVLGRYYEDLTTRELAQRQGVAESSVRSQETRALEMLRKDLDHEFDGGRATWSALLLPLARRDDVVVPTLLKAATVGVGVASLAAVALVVARATRVEETKASLLGNAPTPPAGNGSSESELAPPVPQRTAVARIPKLAVAPTASELEATDTATLLVLAQQVQRELRTKLLTPEPRWAAFLPATRTQGVARILERDQFGQFAPIDSLGIREGGSYFSFVTRSNSFDDSPTLKLEQGRFDTRGTGGLVDLGNVALENLPSGPGRLPPTDRANDLLAEQWALLWSDARTTDQGYREGLREELERLKLVSAASAIPEHTYVSRTIAPGEVDVLAAFRVLARDDYGFTIAWRVLKDWSVHAPKTPRPQSDATAPEAPSWLKSLGIEELLTLQRKLHALGSERLIQPSSTPLPELRSFGGRTDVGIARLLVAGRYDALVGTNGGGAFLSFTSSTRAFGYESHLGLQRGNFTCDFWGGSSCLLMDLGDVDLASVDASGARGPTGSSVAQVRRWRFLWDLRAPVSGPRHERTWPDDTRTKAYELDLVTGARAVAGRTYVLRHLEADPEKPDFVVAFRDVAADADGHTIVWRMLKTFPVEVAEPK